MKKKIASALLTICFIVPATSFAAGQPETTVVLNSFEEKLSYSMGFEVGNYFKRVGGDIKKEMLLQGISDAYDDVKPILTPEEMVTVQKEFSLKMEERQRTEMALMLAKNKATGDAYLEENKKKEGVIVTESGLQYEVITQGDGEKPKATDKVKVDYVGTLIDGREFDSSIKRGEPAVFSVGQVISGWGEALQLMNVGTKLRLVIPSDIAYGEQGVAPSIQPNSVLIFEVELLAIEKE